CVRPDIQVVAALDDPIANAEDVATIEDEHFICDLEIAHAVAVYEQVNLLDDGVRAPEAVRVCRTVAPCGQFAAFERGLDTAERAVIGTTERRVQCRVRLAIV